MIDILSLLMAPLTACIVLAGMYCYLGLHVVSREVIFVDLSLAQIAALGGAVGMLFGFEIDSTPCLLFSLGFAMLGAVIFALGRFRDDCIPQEAIIGITYAVASALAVLVLDRSPHGHEEIKTMLLGSILFVDWPQVLKTGALCIVIGIVHFLLRDKFFLISTNIQEARRQGLKIWLWDLIFYASFGLIVTSSVRIAGVLLIFTLLVVPAASSLLFFQSIPARLFFGWAIGFIGSVVGVLVSMFGDLPTGASIVATFGMILVLCALCRKMFHIKN